MAAQGRRWLAQRAAAGTDLVHRVEHRCSRGRLEFAGEDRRIRRDSVVPLLEECQAIQSVLLCEERRGRDFRRLLFHSQTIDIHGIDLFDDDQAGRMLLAEEAREVGSRLKTRSHSARRSTRVDIELRLRTD